MCALGKVGLDGTCCRPAEGHETLLASLAADPHDSLLQLDIAEIESHQFADPETRGVKKLHCGAVTAPRGGVRKPLEELLDFVAVGDLRRSLDIVWVGHGICGARLESALSHQEAEIGPEGGECTRNRARLETARVEVGKVGAHGDWCRLSGLFVVELRGDEFDEAGNFAAVGAESCGREIAPSSSF